MYYLNDDLGFSCLFCGSELFGYSICEKCNALYVIDLEKNLINPRAFISSIKRIVLYFDSYYYIHYNIFESCIEIYLTKLNGMISINHYALHNILEYDSKTIIPINNIINEQYTLQLINKYIKYRNIW